MARRIVAVRGVLRIRATLYVFVDGVAPVISE
jgi:hypothetical protein